MNRKRAITKQLVDKALENRETRITVDISYTDWKLIWEIRRILEKLESKRKIVIEHMDSDEFIFNYEGPDTVFVISFPDS